MRTLVLCLSVLMLSGACASGGDAARGERDEAGADVLRVDFRTSPPVGKWRLVAFAASDAAVVPEVTLIVQESGEVAGNGGCNGYFGKWSLSASQQTLGPVGATRRMCQPEVMAVEDRYFEALSGVAGWRATDAGMVLVDASGKPSLVFRAQD